MKNNNKFNEKTHTTMKSNTLIMLLLSFCFVFNMIACTEDKPVTTTNEGSIQGGVLSGTFTKDFSIPKGDYYLKGTVEVNDGATLTIAAGCTFTVRNEYKDLTNVLVIKQGAKIHAQGTATEPIVFTSETKESGQWGGIVMLGKSTINVKGGTANAEAGGYPYGGTSPTDNSGTLSYVRLEYAGAKIADGKAEYNAFSFYSVGSGTTLNNLEAYKGADDGFEFYGGTVNSTNLLAVDCEDDSFDWDQGFTATCTNWIAQQDATGDNGVECSNHNTEQDNKPTAIPNVTGLTIYRKALKSMKSATDSIMSNVGITLKDGTGGNLTNVYMKGVFNGFYVGDSITAVLITNNPDRFKLNTKNIDASGSIISYKKPTFPQIDNELPANDATVKGASTDWTGAAWVKGYTPTP